MGVSQDSVKRKETRGYLRTAVTVRTLAFISVVLLTFKIQVVVGFPMV